MLATSTGICYGLRQIKICNMSDFSNMYNERDEHSKSSFAQVLAHRNTRDCVPTLDQLEDVIQKGTTESPRIKR